MPNSSIPGIRKIRHASDTNFGLPNPSKDGLVVTYEASTDKLILAAAPGGGGGTNNHAALLNLSYAASGHTGFAGTGVANTFTQLQTFALGASVTGGNLAVTNNANVTGDVNVGDDVTVTGDVTAASIISPLLTSATNVDVTINPGGTGKVQIPNDTGVRSSTFDSSFPIGGWQIAPTDIAGQSGLTIGEIQADELSVRVFVADEVRVDRGDEYWTKSYGILARRFTTPASIGANLTITFEDSAALTGPIASDNDWVLLRKADIDTGISVVSCWGQLVGYVDNGDGTQEWEFVHRQGNVSEEFLKGAVATIFGQSGAALIHLSTIDSAGSPYIKMRRWVTNPYTPANYTTYVQVGRLSGIGNTYYSPSGYGFYATPSSLSGGQDDQFIVIDDNGFQIRGADFLMYNGSTQTVSIASSNGSMKLGSNVANSNTTGFHFDGATGNITIGGGSYSPTVTVYGQIVVKANSSGYANYTDKPANLSAINSAEGTKLTGISPGATVGATWGTNLNSIPTRFGDAPGSAGLYLTPTHMGYYDGAAWKAWIASNGFFYFGGNSGAHLEWNGTKLRGIGTNGSTEMWYANSTDGILYAGAGAVWMDQNGYNIAATQFGNADLIRFMRSGSVLASIGYQRNAGGGPLTTDGMIFSAYEGTKFRFVGGTKIEHDGGMTVDDFIETFGRLQGNGLVVQRGALTSAAQIQGTTFYSEFAYDTSENTYIRGGKAGSHVVLNDAATTGNVLMATGGGNVGVNEASPTYPLTVKARTSDTAPALNLRAYTTGADGTRTAVVRYTSSSDTNWARARHDAYSHHFYNSAGAEQGRIDGAGVVGNGATTVSAQGYDNVRMGVISGAPIIVWEDAGQTQWGIDNASGNLRFITPGNAHAFFNGANGHLNLGGAPGTFDWRLNVLESTYQISLNPNFGGLNYISSYNGAVGAPLGLYGTRVFADADSFGILTAKTPTSSADASGNVGDHAWDANYIYVKTGVGAWKRAALSTF